MSSNGDQRLARAEKNEQDLRSLGLISESELAEYEAIPMEQRAVWEQTDLLERSRLRVLKGGRARHE